MTIVKETGPILWENTRLMAAILDFKMAAKDKGSIMSPMGL